MNRDEIAPIIVGKLMNIGGMMRRNADHMLTPYGLNQQQFSIFFAIGEEDRVNQKNMVNKLVLEKAHVSKVVKKLHGMGLITIEPNEEDRRSSWLSVTEEGRKVLAECTSLFREWNRSWAEGMDSDSLHALLDGLDDMQRILKKDITSQR